MITYQKPLQPASLSLKDVTSYLRELIEFTQQDSKRLHAYAEEEIPKEVQDALRERSWSSEAGKSHYRSQVPRWYRTKGHRQSGRRVIKFLNTRFDNSSSNDATNH